MKRLTFFFWLLFFGFIGIAGAYIFAEHSSSKLARSLRPHTRTLTPIAQSLTKINQNAETSKPAQIPEVSILAKRGQELSKHVGAVLGESVTEVSPEQQPLHERAIEYGQYLYCKGIIEEYESNHSIE